MKLINIKDEYIITVIFILIFKAAMALEPPSDEVGMVVKLNGDVEYWSEISDGKAAKAQNFMKIHRNDSFYVPPDSFIEVVYFSNGRKEMWKGAIVFKVGETEGKASDKFSDVVPHIDYLLPSVTKEVQYISSLADPYKIRRIGGYQVRGLRNKPLKSIDMDEKQKQEVEEAKKTYTLLVKDAATDDIVPELYLFSVMETHLQYEEMESLLEVMRKKQPDNHGIDSLEIWMKNKARN